MTLILLRYFCVNIAAASNLECCSGCCLALMRVSLRAVSCDSLAAVAATELPQKLM